MTRLSVSRVLSPIKSEASHLSSLDVTIELERILTIALAGNQRNNSSGQSPCSR